MGELVNVQREHTSRQDNQEYSKATKATAIAQLISNDFNQSKTARELDLPRSTVAYWARQYKQGEFDADEELEELIQTELEGAAPLLKQLWVAAAHSLLRDLRSGNINPRDRNAVFGTAFDKWRLASGQSTQNVEQKVRVVNVQGDEL